jgi:hypothetical protein
VGVAKSFGLLRLPKMPELKKINCEEWKDADVDVNISPLCASWYADYYVSGIILLMLIRPKRQNDKLLLPIVSWKREPQFVERRGNGILRGVKRRQREKNETSERRRRQEKRNGCRHKQLSPSVLQVKV